MSLKDRFDKFIDYFTEDGEETTATYQPQDEQMIVSSSSSASKELPAQFQSTTSKDANITRLHARQQELAMQSHRTDEKVTIDVRYPRKYEDATEIVDLLEFLWLIGEAIFHMLPVGICWSVTKKMGTTQILGIVLGLTLVSGQLLNAYGVAGATEIPVWDFDFFQVKMIGYQAQVIPAMLAAFTLVYIEKFFKRIVPQVVSMIAVPFFSLLLSVVAAHFVLGPIGWAMGSAISKVVYAGITGPFKILFAAAL